MYARPHAAIERAGRPRVHRQRRQDAHREVRRLALVRARRRARRRRHPRGRRPVRAAGRRPDRRGHHGPGPAGGRRPGPGAAGPAAGRARRHDLGHDHQPRLWLGPQVDHVQRRRHPRRRRRRVRRGRHGVDEPGAVPAAQGPVRLPAGQRDAGGLDGPRRPVVQHRGLPHGHPRRAGGHQGPGLARGPGRVRAGVPPARGRRHRRGPVRGRAGAGHRPRRQGPRDRGRGRRGPAPGHDRRGAGEAGARLRPPGRRGSRLGDDRDRDRRQRARDHGRRRGDGRGLGAGRRDVRPPAAGPDRRLRAGRGRAEVAVPRAGPGRARPRGADGAADRRLRPDRDQRGVRGAGPRRRPRARLRLVEGQRQRRRDRARPPDRGIGRPDRGHAPPRAQAPRRSLRDGDPVPGRRRLGRDGVRAGV